MKVLMSNMRIYRPDMRHRFQKGAQMGVEIYGRSDDLIEVDGDIREEFGYHYREEHIESKFLAFSDGTVVRVRYGQPGTYGWELHVMTIGTGSSVNHQPATNHDDNYSDVVNIEGVDIRWVVVGEQFVMAMYLKE